MEIDHHVVIAVHTFRQAQRRTRNDKLHIPGYSTPHVYQHGNHGSHATNRAPAPTGLAGEQGREPAHSAIGHRSRRDGGLGYALHTPAGAISGPERGAGSTCAAREPLRCRASTPGSATRWPVQSFPARAQETSPNRLVELTPAPPTGAGRVAGRRPGYLPANRSLPSVPMVRAIIGVAQDTAGQSAAVLAVFHQHLAVDDGHLDALCRFPNAHGAGREVVDDFVR